MHAVIEYIQFLRMHGVAAYISPQSSHPSAFSRSTYSLVLLCFYLSGGGEKSDLKPCVYY